MYGWCVTFGPNHLLTTNYQQNQKCMPKMFLIRAIFGQKARPVQIFSISKMRADDQALSHNYLHHDSDQMVFFSDQNLFI